MQNSYNNELELAARAVNEKHYAQAIFHYENLLKHNKVTPEIANNLSLLYIKHGDIEKAKNILEIALQDYPKIASLHKQLGNIWRNLSELSRARNCYEQAILLDEKDASAHNNLGLIFLQENELAEAENSFKKALKLTPEYTSAMYDLALCYKA